MEVVKHISPRAEPLVSEYGLGQVRAEYRESVLKRGLIFTALLPVGLVMLALTLPTLLAPALTDGDWWQRMGNLSYLLMGGSCFSLLGVIGVVLLVLRSSMMIIKGFGLWSRTIRLSSSFLW